jgi:hypothetical protein
MIHQNTALFLLNSPVPGSDILNRYEMTGALGGGPSLLAVDLCCGDVAVAETFLDLPDIHIRVGQQGRRRRLERMRRVDVALDGRAIGELFFFQGSRQFFKVKQNQQV